MTKIEYSLRPATGADVPKVAALVNDAYGHYVERIRILPRPMIDDYAEVIANRRVTIAEHHGAIVGVIVLTVDDEGFLIDNVAVDPSEGPSSSLRKPEPGARGSILFIYLRTRRCRRTSRCTRGSDTSSTIDALRGSFPSST
jgi:hypothetical protein